MMRIFLLTWLLLAVSMPISASGPPNELTRHFCSNIKIMAEQVKQGRELGIAEDDYLEWVAENSHKFSETRNIELVSRVVAAVVKGAWVSEEEPEAYSNLVHETCLETIVLVP